jgi:AraC family transcriptional regulator
LAPIEAKPATRYRIPEKMTRPAHSSDYYGKRLAAVIEYIDKHLAEPLPLSALAAKASFSPNHFHKIFSEWMGETPQSYLRRCRLERAAALLRYGLGLTVKEIAPQCSFKSPESFDRAFHSYFGMTPTEWRAGGHAGWNKSSANRAIAPPVLSDKQVEVKTLQPFRVVYKRKIGPYSEGEDALWSELAELVMPLQLHSEEYYSIGLDDPSVTPSNRCRFDACIKLPPLVSVPKNMPVRTIPGGYYAILRYDGPGGATANYWSWLFQTWLPRSGFKISQNACVEHYPFGIPKVGAHVRSELWLPLVR